jgi:ABC-type transport system involved in multi-copper enzyme maturation permease subunit
MLNAIIIKELQENFKSYKFVIILFACLFLTGFSNFEMYKHYRDNLKNQAFKPLEDDQYYIQKRPTALSIYVLGTQEIIERTFLFKTGASKVTELSNGMNLNFYRQLFPILDFPYVIKVVLSFLAMILGFDLICGEKNKGTLKLILSNSVSRNQLISGKLIGNFLIIALPFSISFLLLYIILNLMPDVTFSYVENLRLFTLYIVSLVYIALFFFISVFISSKSNSSRTSITYCFFIWLTLVFFIPNIGTIISKYFTNLPSEILVEEKKMDNQNDILFNNLNKSKEWVNEEIYKKDKEITNEYRKNIQKQISINNAINTLSPAGAYMAFCSNIANYGFYDEDKIHNSITNYIENNRNKNTQQSFYYTELDLSTSYSKSVGNIICILIYTLMFCLLIYIAFYKYDVR